jgi:hypothetical protein
VNLTLRDKDGEPTLQVEGPDTDGDYKLSMFKTCFGSGTARHLTAKQMEVLKDSLVGEFAE